VIPWLAPETTRGNELKYVQQCLETGWVSGGSFVQRFESEFGAYVGAANTVAVANGTVGLHVALLLAGVRAEDEVLVSNLTHISPVNAISYCGAHPVLVDANPVDWQIDVNKTERFLELDCEMRGGQCFDKNSGRRVRAIVPVHILGLAAPIDRIVSLARKYGLVVVEDAAESLGVRYKGQLVGTFGDIGVFSFNALKIMTAGNGGMLVLSDPELAKRARYLIAQAKDDPVEYIHNEIGYNYGLSNVHAAIGVAQLERIAEFISKKRNIAERYEAAFSQMKSVSAMPCPPDVEPTYSVYTVLLAPGTSLDRRKRVVRRLNEEGIGAVPFLHPMHGLPPYRLARTVEIEHSMSLYERGISLPCGVGLSNEDLEKCIDVFRQVVEEDAILR
jgi:perosamine synthetase